MPYLYFLPSFPFEDLRLPLGRMRLPRSLTMGVDKWRNNVRFHFHVSSKDVSMSWKKTLNLSSIDNVYFLF
jgi:hypothetical protein